MCVSIALSMIRRSEAGDAWSVQDREDTAGPLSEGPLYQGDQPGFVGVSGDGPEGFAFGGDGVRLRAPDAVLALADDQLRRGALRVHCFSGDDRALQLQHLEQRRQRPDLVGLCVDRHLAEHDPGPRSKRRQFDHLEQLRERVVTGRTVL